MFGPTEFRGGQVRAYGCAPGCLLASLLVSLVLTILVFFGALAGLLAASALVVIICPVARLLSS